MNSTFLLASHSKLDFYELTFLGKLTFKFEVSSVKIYSIKIESSFGYFEIVYTIHGQDY